jgi:hypothetical protein
MKRPAGLVLPNALRIRGGEEERGSWWYVLYRNNIFFSTSVAWFGLEKEAWRGRGREERGGKGTYFRWSEG